jgi:hypothetical protein
MMRTTVFRSFGSINADGDDVEVKVDHGVLEVRSPSRKIVNIFAPGEWSHVAVFEVKSE